MDRDLLERQWLAEERAAHIRGWDFSHIRGRYTEEDDLPWDYGRLVRESLEPAHRLLDVDTGGGEFLLSLGHPYALTSATEAYPPNVRLCQSTLVPLGIDFREADGAGGLPFPNNAFDRAINRHGDFNAAELFRVLKPGGLLITEQVGAENDRALVERLLPGTPMPFPDLYLDKVCRVFARSGFQIVRQAEAFRPIKFYDIGALVWFAHVIEWEFPGFSVARCLPELFAAQQTLMEQGCVTGEIHRLLLVARKPE